jgi:colicin import membrane protein
MWQIIRQHPRAAVTALIFHVALITVLLVSFSFSDKSSVTVRQGPEPESIDAVAIDEQEIRQRQTRLKEAERRKLEAQKRKQNEAAEKKRRAAEAKKRQQREAEEKQRRAAEAKKREQQAAAEKKKLAVLAEQKKEAERKRVEAERQAEKERQQREAEEQKARQAEIARELQAQQAEAERQARLRQQAMQSEIQKYMARIQQKIVNSWNIPPETPENRHCTVRVRLFPGGDVRDVTVISKSGDPAFDRSVEAAVRRAEPLPVPTGSELFDKFREVIFEFEPRNKI